MVKMAWALTTVLHLHLIMKKIDEVGVPIPTFPLSSRAYGGVKTAEKLAVHSSLGVSFLTLK